MLLTILFNDVDLCIMDFKQMAKELKKRRISAASMARDVGISPAYMTMILRGRAPYPPKKEITDKMIAWFQRCPTCHRDWPKRD